MAKPKLSNFRTQRLNANKHTPRGLALLADSIGKDGWIGAMTVAADGETFDGSARLEVLADAMPSAEPIVVDSDGTRPVIVRRTDIASTDDPRAKRLGLGANRIAQVDLDWDADALAALAGEVDLSKLWNKDELAELLKGMGGNDAEDPGAQVDKAAELQAKWGTELNQLWQVGRHRLLVGDCTVAENVARLMGGEKADCVFTSPPYAVGVDYGDTYEDTIDNLRAMLPKLAALWVNVVEVGGFAVVNFGDIAGGRDVAGATGPCEYPMALEYFPVFRAAGWVLWSRRAWCKPNARVNSLWCIGSNRAATDWENIWTFKMDGPEAIIKRVDGEFSSANGWYQSSRLHGVDVGKDDHGAGMALGIAHWMLTVHSRPGAIVHEPYCGTGTTIVAGEQLDRSVYAADISPAYAAVTLERLHGLGLTPELVS